MTAEERRTWVEEILWVAQKTRSNLREAIGDDEVGRNVLADLNPRLNPENPLNLIDVCIRVLDGDREVSPQDLYNVLYLARQDATVEFAFAFREKDLPEPMAAYAA